MPWMGYIALLLLCATATLGAALAHAEPYPRVACYAALRSNGAP
jgi:hypothetical protein